MSKILVLRRRIVGLSTAMILARRCHDVTVFERDSEPLPLAGGRVGIDGKEGALSSPASLPAPARNPAPRFHLPKREAKKA